MSTIRLTTGLDISLDGDLLAVIEALYHEVTLKRSFGASFEDMMREIRGIIDQMSEDDCKRYLVESLFLNTVTYENERLGSYANRLTAKKKKQRSRATGG
ncbi:MAG: hypothetical protein JXO72_01755 [Vicinamibacteria bacterium]|nr:hypothetical protein [Vicinamibacteria bacterium]